MQCIEAQRNTTLGWLPQCLGRVLYSSHHNAVQLFGYIKVHLSEVFTKLLPVGVCGTGLEVHINMIASLQFEEDSVL